MQGLSNQPLHPCFLKASKVSTVYTTLTSPSASVGWMLATWSRISSQALSRFPESGLIQVGLTPRVPLLSLQRRPGLSLRIQISLTVTALFLLGLRCSIKLPGAFLLHSLYFSLPHLLFILQTCIGNVNRNHPTDSTLCSLEIFLCWGICLLLLIFTQASS